MRLDEFMIIKNKNNDYGIIIRNDDLYLPFRIVYQVGGQVICTENFTDYIEEIYESNRRVPNDILYDALQFFTNPEKNILNYRMIYKRYEDKIDYLEEMRKYEIPYEKSDR